MSFQTSKKTGLDMGWHEASGLIAGSAATSHQVVKKPIHLVQRQVIGPKNVAIEVVRRAAEGDYLMYSQAVDPAA